MCIGLMFHLMKVGIRSLDRNLNFVTIYNRLVVFILLLMKIFLHCVGSKAIFTSVCNKYDFY